MRYIILATDTTQLDATVYYSDLGWTTRRADATKFTRAKLDAKLYSLTDNPNITKRFRDIVEVAA